MRRCEHAGKGEPQPILESCRNATDEAMASSARFVHARENASGEIPRMLLENTKEPVTAKTNARAERPINPLIMISMCFTSPLLDA
jgi:hypothetical protein